MPDRLVRPFLRDLPIRRKLILLIMLTTAGAMLLAGVALILIDLRSFRRDMENDLSTLAVIVARNSTAALSFADPEAAEETLEALEVQKPIVAAAVYTEAGNLFATYPEGARGRDADIPDRPGKDGVALREGSLDVFSPIQLDGTRIGTVYLRSDMREIYGRLRLQVATVTAVFLMASLAALLLSSALQRVISKPIQHLADTARAVSERQDYSIRAVRESRDELGQLVEAFNDMLGQIQQRDSELLLAKAQLERRVEERTVALRQELTERQRAESELEERNEELHRSNRELDDFAYIASHDLKEPLRGIHNYSVFLMEDYADKLDEDGRAKLETLTRLSRRMETLIDSLLQFSRLGRVDLAIDDVDLNGVLEEVLDSVAINLKENGVEVRIPRPLPTVLCDRVRIRELYYNLIVNAMKYNDKPEKWIEIGWREDGPALPPAFWVRDNGIGIQEKHYESIFRIFKRLHGRDKFGGGTGAGLTIVKKIVERHNGRIWVESALGEGTAVFFTLEKEREA